MVINIINIICGIVLIALSITNIYDIICIAKREKKGKTMINISKEEIGNKMFFIRKEDSNQPIAVIKVSDLLDKEVKKNDR